MTAPPTAAATPSERSLLSSFWFLMGSVALLDFVFGAVYVRHMLDIGLSASMIGLSFAVSGAASSLLDIPSGALGDRFGQKTVMLAGIGMWAAGQLMFGLSGSLFPVLMSLLLWGAGQAFFSGAPVALMINSLDIGGDPARIGTVVRGAHVSRWLAAALGGLAVFALGGAVSTGILITGSGILLLGIGVWVALAWPGTGRGERTEVWTAFVRAFGSYWKETQLVLVLLQAASVASALGLVIIAWQPLLIEDFHVGSNMFGLVLVAFMLASAGGGLISKKLSEALSLNTIIFAGTGLAIVATAGSALGLWVALGCLCISQFAAGAATTAVFTRAHGLFEDSLRSTQSSILSFTVGIFMALVDACFGALWQAFGALGAVQIMCAALCLLLVATLGLRAAIR